MKEPEPAYYSSLAPFRDWFGQGLPILTWHKLGPRPRGVRLKGMYLPDGRFARQLAELREAEFRSATLDQAVPAKGNPHRQVALTFDDGYVNVLRHGLEPLARCGYRATQFLVADRLGQSNVWDAADGEVLEPLMDAAQVRDWLGAGQAIGSHALTHPDLTALEPAQAREEITASKHKLEDLFGRPVDHFCYPFGSWNPRVRDMVAEAGYRTACTTDCGINRPADSPYEWKRITARYPTRRWKNLMSSLRRWLGPHARP